MTSSSTRAGFLLLEDGTLFRGVRRDADVERVAEVVFTTNMTGYQEVFTDPSFSDQIVVMTTPMIGNYGVNTEDSGVGDAAGERRRRARADEPPVELAREWRSQGLAARRASADSRRG